MCTNGFSHHLGTSIIGVGYSNQIQVAQGQDLHYGGALVQAAFGCCIPYTPILVPKMVLTVQLVLVVVFGAPSAPYIVFSFK